MKNTTLFLSVILALSAARGDAQVTKPEKGSRAERKVIDLRITPNPALPNVLLILEEHGDIERGSQGCGMGEQGERGSHHTWWSQ